MTRPYKPRHRFDGPVYREKPYFPEAVIMLLPDWMSGTGTIMDTVVQGMRSAGVPDSLQDMYRMTALTTPYRHQLTTAERWVTVLYGPKVGWLFYNDGSDGMEDERPYRQARLPTKTRRHRPRGYWR